MRSRARCFDELLDFIAGVPIVDVHDHAIDCGPAYADALDAVLLGGYVMMQIGGLCTAAEAAYLRDATQPMAERWPLAERLWRKARFTGFGHQARRMLQMVYGEEELTLDALRRISGRVVRLTDPAVFESFLEKAKIVARLTNVNRAAHLRLIEGKPVGLPPRSLPVPPLFFAPRTRAEAQDTMALLGRTAKTFDDYLDGCAELTRRAKRHGAVALKTAMAHVRSLAVGNPTRAEAEALFNALLSDRRRVLGAPEESRPLEDYLIHAALRTAAEVDLPVQVHTGVPFGGDLRRASALLLAPLLEVHRDVRFDLLHGNWPNGPDALYLLSQHPNAVLNFAPVHVMDPIDCQRMLMQAVSAVPHARIIAFGNDSCGNSEWDWAAAQMARENIAIALSELVEMEYLGLDDAKEVAQAWLFDNANAFFRLGLEAPAREAASAAAQAGHRQARAGRGAKVRSQK